MGLYEEMPPYDEMSVMHQGFTEGRHAAEATERLEDAITHEDRFRAASAWLGYFESAEGLKGPAAKHLPQGYASMIRRLHGARLWAVWRAGYLSGLVSSFAEMYAESYRMLPEEARALGAARGHALVYGMHWPRRTAPHEVASGAVEAAITELSSGDGPPITQAIYERGGEMLRHYREGLLGALDEAVRVYLNHSGRYHLYVPPERPGADTGARPGTRKATRKRRPLAIVRNRGRRWPCACGGCQ